jgi:excisionase family DNA binding protein
MRRHMKEVDLDLRDLITPEELCELLQVKMTWVYRQVREGNIPHHKLGKYLRFHRPTVGRWVLKNEVKR